MMMTILLRFLHLLLLFHLCIIHLCRLLAMSNIENNFNLTQKLLLGDTPQQEKIVVAVGEKASVVVKKVIPKS